MKLFLQAACLLAVASASAVTVVNQTTTGQYNAGAQSRQAFYASTSSPAWRLDSLVYSGISTASWQGPALTQSDLHASDFTVTFWKDWDTTVRVGDVVTASSVGTLTTIGTGSSSSKRFSLTFDLSNAGIVYKSGYSNPILFTIQTSLTPLWTVGGALTNNANASGWVQDYGLLKVPMVLEATPVPEPSTYGLMLGGLALCAVGIRRRKKTVA